MTAPQEVVPRVIEPRPDPRLTGVAGLVLLTVDGALLGAFGVVFAQIHTAGVPVPMGVVLSMLILPWLVLRAGELDDRPGVAAAPLAAWFAVVAVLAVGGPGGDVLVPVNWQSGALVFGGLGAGLWALRRVLERGTGG
ncbi:hypothetical protein [Pseudonocardia hydrocarbonoxydans]|uniref:Uncharacterized protein n=1 Tax=Pseudonocardia hydrocarbonoxydans TaxID=76726 RepID=A0A4Y3WPE0_9PSEU|nr:hypothetical protein [Pseudonocardia hydrocarbonoxydans]GEC20723.1 hypothetical protein PHY01_30060 [Pseudonocardia hydrocarbonoxydans]